MNEPVMVQYGPGWNKIPEVEPDGAAMVAENRKPDKNESRQPRFANQVGDEMPQAITSLQAELGTHQGDRDVRLKHSGSCAGIAGEIELGNLPPEESKTAKIPAHDVGPGDIPAKQRIHPEGACEIGQRTDCQNRELSAVLAGNLGDK